MVLYGEPILCVPGDDILRVRARVQAEYHRLFQINLPRYCALFNKVVADEQVRPEQYDLFLL